MRKTVCCNIWGEEWTLAQCENIVLHKDMYNLNVFQNYRNVKTPKEFAVAFYLKFACSIFIWRKSGGWVDGSFLHWHTEFYLQTEKLCLFVYCFLWQKIIFSVTFFQCFLSSPVLDQVFQNCVLGSLISESVDPRKCRHLVPPYGGFQN